MKLYKYTNKDIKCTMLFYFTDTNWILRRFDAYGSIASIYPDNPWRPLFLITSAMPKSIYTRFKYESTKL